VQYSANSNIDCLLICVMERLVVVKLFASSTRTVSSIEKSKLIRVRMPSTSTYLVLLVLVMGTDTESYLQANEPGRFPQKYFARLREEEDAAPQPPPDSYVNIQHGFQFQSN